MIKRLTKCAVQESNLQPTDSTNKRHGAKTRSDSTLALRIGARNGVSSGRRRAEVATKSQSEPLGTRPPSARQAGGGVMAPYYAAGGVTLYHGECREILPSIDRPCAIVTDPPYGTGWVRGSGAVGVFNATREQPAWDVWSTDWLWLPPDVQAHAVFAPLSRAADLRSALGTPSAVAHWRKTNPRPNGPDRDAIVIRPAYLPDGIEFRAYNGDTPLHPCQKPLDLMQWVLGFVPPELLVVDPFAGSGTTLEAARNIGREAVGIEANEAYCATIVERLSQGVLALEVPA